MIKKNVNTKNHIISAEKFNSLFNAAEKITESDPQSDNIAYIVRLLSWLSLPKSSLKTPDGRNCTEYLIKNGNTTISLTAPEKSGIPYGVYPRILRMHIEDTVKKTGDKTINIGNNLHQVFNLLDLKDGLGQRREFLKQLVSLAGVTFNLTFIGLDRDRLINLYPSFKPIKNCVVIFDPKNPKGKHFWDGEITITQEYYDLITRNHETVPLDMRAVKALKSSPLALDILTWLNTRFYSVKEKSNPIPWQSLQNQFGSNYKQVRDFRRDFMATTQKVVTVCPYFKLDFSPDTANQKGGLVLYPSRPTILMKDAPFFGPE